MFQTVRTDGHNSRFSVNIVKGCICMPSTVPRRIMTSWGITRLRFLSRPIEDALKDAQETQELCVCNVRHQVEMITMRASPSALNLTQDRSFVLDTLGIKEQFSQLRR
jgi:hypothetical protein